MKDQLVVQVTFTYVPNDTHEQEVDHGESSYITIQWALSDEVLFVADDGQPEVVRYRDTC